MSHTPGPWAVHHYGDNEGDIHGSDGKLVCMLREGDTAPEDDWSADARLIAAAPDLLSVCQSIAGDLEALLDGDDFSGMSDAELFGVMLRSLKAAIAKAEGVTMEGTNGKERSLD